MAKILTPDIVQFEKKHKKKQMQEYSYWRNAWIRLKKTPTAIIGLVIVLIIVFVAIFADVIAPYPFDAPDYTAILQPPSAAHLFGTDEMGRDVFSRCIYGARYSLPVGVLCCLASLAIGGLIGLFAAFFGKNVDLVLMRIVDVFQAIPAILMAILVVAMVGKGIPQLILAITVGFVPEMAKMVRAAILTVRNGEFVEACDSIGASNSRLMFRHLVPNAIGFVLISVVNCISGGILMVAMMSYISLGVQPPAPEWGFMLSASRSYLSAAPNLVIFPGLMIMLTVLSFNLLADGLRDALDPRLK